jgi:hypothetical protein
VHCLVGVDWLGGGGLLANRVDTAVLSSCTRFPEVELVDQAGGIVDKFTYWRRE